MIELLKNDYPKHYKTKLKQELSLWETQDVDFEIVDPKGGQESPKLCSTGEGDAVYHNALAKHLTVINIDTYFSQFGDKQAGRGKRCDLMWYADDLSIFALDELTSGKEQSFVDLQKSGNKWIKGPLQLEESAQRLLAVPAVKKRIFEFNHRKLIFSYRVTEKILSEQEKKDNPSAFAQSQFLLAAQNMDSLTMRDSKVEGFELEYHRYPTPYNI